jgi:hypothetical protein
VANAIRTIIPTHRRTRDWQVPALLAAVALAAGYLYARSKLFHPAARV